MPIPRRWLISLRAYVQHLSTSMLTQILFRRPAEILFATTDTVPEISMGSHIQAGETLQIDRLVNFSFVVYFTGMVRARLCEG